MSRGANGFSLLELLIALTICLLVTAALAALLPPSRAAFEQVPLALDADQRIRTAVDVLTRAVRGAGVDGVTGVSVSDPGDPAGSARLTTVTVSTQAGQGFLAEDQAGGELVLSSSRCPAAPDVCGFEPGDTVAIASGAGGFEVFTVGATNVTRHTVATTGALSGAYLAGTRLVEVEAATFRLALQADGSRSLVRETHAGAVQPLIDHVLGLVFHAADPDGAVREVEFSIVVQPSPRAAGVALRDHAQRSSARSRNAW
jgi:prepilin-type N-terminal cleavage/methylation domain-containing protein